MASLSTLEALRLATLYIKEYIEKIADTKLDSDDIDPEEVLNTLSSLDARISAIVAGAGNDEASSAEILDARVSGSGTEYTTLGTHIRAIESGEALNDGSITASHLASGAVTPEKLSDSFKEAYHTAAELDAALTELDDAVSALETKASTLTTQTASAATAATKAQDTADKAQATADDAQNAADKAQATGDAAQTSANKAQATADQAASGVANTDNSVAELSTEVDALKTGQSKLEDLTATFADGMEVDSEGLVYLTNNGVIVAGPYGPFAGTGGSGSGNGTGYTMTFKSLLSSRSLTVAEGNSAILSVEYSCTDTDGVDDGDGIGTVTVNSVKKATVNIAQGTNNIDVSGYLSSGDNTVKLKVENSEGSSRTLSFSVSVISLSLTTTFDSMGVYAGSQIFAYTVTGSGTKTVHFLMDGTELGSEEVASSGRSRSYIIPAQSDGAHVLTVYAEATVNDTTVRSNTLTVGMIWASESASEPSVLSTYDTETATQGEILSVPYMVYDPQSETASVTLAVLNADGTAYSSTNLTVDRTAQTWAVQDYPVGEITLQITCGTASWEHALTVEESSIVIEAVEDGLALCFDPTGRSNQEDTPESWTDGSVSAAFTGIGFANADGWLTDSDGASVLRILPGGQMSIPYNLFATDARSSGLTVEVEMATHNVRDYDTVVLSCLSNGRGFQIASQYAKIASEQSSLSMQFKEDEKVRVSFVVEPKNLHRLIYVYVDGIMCGAIQYPEDDDFSQSPAVGLTVGAESSGIDIYRIRLYTKGLTRHEILDNYIAERTLLSDRVAAYQRNDIFDTADEIVVSKLPATLPYMLIKCAELPQYKGDKKTCEIEYVNPSDSSRSFTATGVQIDVQGTSSSGYKKKNWKLKLKSGVTYTASGTASDTYLLREDSVPATVFCTKADVASSEGANNVELARLYNDTVPYQTPAQEEDERVRVGIDGLPCVVFWQNTDTNDVSFWGKYNFNFDKSAETVFGLTDGCESWEVLNNTSNRVLFKSADFSDSAWMDDFEARYPEDNTDYTNLKTMCDWVVSTDRSAVSTEAEKTERLTKFKDEFEEHFVKTPMLFYYLFTEVFLMVDSRAKNFFPTTFDGTHWFPFPYDFDTAIGINNEGQLVFDYDLEDTDTVDGDQVFNGQESVLWCNIRDAFGDEIKELYNTLRSGSVFNYSEVVQRYAEHQAVWPEAVWNEDAWNKYLEPLENDNDSAYLTMLQGSKASQREWWLYNGFRYRDSKYQCGDAASNYITLRCYEVGDISVTPYSHIWPRIKYGSYTVTERGKRNTTVTLACPLDTMNDTEVYIYSADRLATIGDLSPLQVGYANFSMATKLQALKLGDSSSDYTNTRLTELYVGNNELLTSLDVQNCTNLAMTVDLSGCVGIETIQAKGTSVTGFTLPVGGKLKTMELPDTVTNLTIREQKQFETLDMAGYTSLTTLRIENTPNVPVRDIVIGASSLNRMRLVGVEWDEESESTLQETITKLKTCIGMDASGSNTDSAVVVGTVTVPSISADTLTEINDAFPQLVVVAGGEAQYVVRYLDWDNTLLYRLVVSEGDDAVDPVTEGYISAPTRESTGTDGVGYSYNGWGTLPTDIHNNVSVVARYITVYRVRYMTDEDTVFNTQWIAYGCSATTPTSTPTKSSTAQYTYTFAGWDSTATNVTEPVDIYATWTATVRTYTVYFYNGTTLLQTVTSVPYGGTATYTGDTPVSADGSADDYPFEGWSPSNSNIQGNTSCYAVFGSPLEVAEIEDSWDTIIANVENGTAADVYKVGNYKSLDLGTEGTVNMQIIGKNVDTLADGSGTATLTWLSMELLSTSHRMNPSLVTNYDESTKAGWVEDSDNENGWKSNNQGNSSTSATATWVVTATEAGTVTISYKVGSEASYDKLTVTVNGTTVASAISGSQDWATYDVECAAGDTVTVVGTYSKDSSGDKNGDTAYVKFASTGAFSVAADITNMTIKTVRDYTEATGSIGGWEKSEMRTYLSETVKPLIPENVLAAIKTVSKNQPAYTTAGASTTQTTSDDVWIPSYTEMFASSGSTNQPRYKVVFSDSASRIKYKAGATSASWWWLRSATTTGIFDYVYSSGGWSYYSADGSGAVALGFCM